MSFRAHIELKHAILLGLVFLTRPSKKHALSKGPSCCVRIWQWQLVMCRMDVRHCPDAGR